NYRVDRLEPPCAAARSVLRALSDLLFADAQQISLEQMSEMAGRGLHHAVVGGDQRGAALAARAAGWLWADLWQPGGVCGCLVLFLAGRLRAGDRRALERGAGVYPAPRRKGHKPRSIDGGMMAGLMEGKRGL